MKSTELRIGNWVGYGLIGDVVDIGVINSICYSDGYLGSFISNSEIESSGGTFFVIQHILPIPLTEEWFAKGNYNKFEGRYIKTMKGGGQIVIDETNNGRFTIQHNNWIRYFDFVHEWQNIHQALTGQELTIKE